MDDDARDAGPEAEKKGTKTVIGEAACGKVMIDCDRGEVLDARVK